MRGDFSAFGQARIGLFDGSIQKLTYIAFWYKSVDFGVLAGALQGLSGLTSLSLGDGKLSSAGALSLSGHTYISIYICIYSHVCMYVYAYMYMYI